MSQTRLKSIKDLLYCVRELIVFTFTVLLWPYKDHKKVDILDEHKVPKLCVITYQFLVCLSQDYIRFKKPLNICIQNILSI